MHVQKRVKGLKQYFLKSYEKSYLLIEIFYCYLKNILLLFFATASNINQLSVTSACNNHIQLLIGQDLRSKLNLKAISVEA